MSAGPRPRNAYGRAKHKADLKQFALELKTAFNQYLPTGKKPYGQVAVLALHWENDTMGVAPLEKELLDVFRKIYGFNVESYIIPAVSTAGRELSKRLHNFHDKWGAEDALCIYVYSGHAEGTDAGGTAYLLG